MQRIDRTRLDAARFAETLELETRFDDLDTQMHANNAAVAVFLQEGRARFNQRVVKEHLGEGVGMVVGAIHIEYASSIYWPGAVEIDTGVIEIGRSSYSIGQVIRQNGKTCVYAETRMVAAGSEGGVPFTDAARAAMEEAMIG